MPITVVATPGAVNANSYTTRAFGDSFAPETEFAAIWSAASDDDKDLALVRATRLLDGLTFYGYPNDSTQALAWPRHGVYDARHALIDRLTIPAVLQQATVLVACYLLAKGNATPTATAFTDAGQDAIASVSVGPVSVTFREAMGPEGTQWLEHAVYPRLVQFRLIYPRGSVRLVR